ncbi:hypothetical protein MHUMG1_06762 [Metarhizium humberi]|uniref:Exonuclease domain-containing protein n=1 Tax=Metarhizium humberi TaxID=2596975 RepID=A0A9P8M6L6_9HYPO|nr:hypothetical protein MHUMG1_06762 [Metarhizium humberi]
MAPGAGDAPPSGVTTDDPLVWIDCEVKFSRLVLIWGHEACSQTCGKGAATLPATYQEGYHAVIHCPASRLDQMDEWCTQTHGNSGLTAAVLASSTTPEQAAEGLYNYITRFIPEKRKALLAGNSVHADRAFLRREPYAKVIDHLHYRILDISAIKEAGRRWCSREIMAQAPVKKGRHLARDDILESIEEARPLIMSLNSSTVVNGPI